MMIAVIIVSVAWLQLATPPGAPGASKRPHSDGVVDFVNPDAIGVRTDDALYGFIRGFQGTLVVGHHLFASNVDAGDAECAWRARVDQLFA